jgi:hypothetical protein
LAVDRWSVLCWAAAVVDENGKLVDTLSASDLRGSSLAGVWFRSKKNETNRL